jgi:hypothetical protein
MKARYLSITALVCLFIVLACENPENPVYGPDNPDPNPGGTQPAVLTDITPSRAFLKEIVTITGSGFNTELSENIVQFGTGVGVVLEATETQLTVELPNLSAITVDCRVAPRGAEEWSNALEFEFNPAILPRAGGLNWPMGVEADDEGNIYVGSANDAAIYKFDVDGNQSVFAADVPVWGALKWGPGGNLYVAAANEGQILSISPDGSTVEVYVDGAGSVSDFDWAENGNLYIIRTWGEGIGMYKDGVVTDLVDGGDMDAKSGRVSGGNLYVSSGWEWAFRKYPITADGLGDGEIVYWDGVIGVEADALGNVIHTIVDTYTVFSYTPEGNVDALFAGELEDDAGSHMRYIRYTGKSLYVVYPGWSGDGEGSVTQVYLGVDQAPNWGLGL